jgi:serine/threonine-protein kinase RsbW/stage II sporulation protein AB (anti-sigma F factor)
MAAVARRCGLSEAAVGDVKLAVSEAATNAVVHAYPGDAVGTITATAWVDEGRLRIAISDEGGGMLPRLDSPGFGLGLPLIAALADDLEIVSRQEGGTEVRIEFPCPANAI